MIKTCLHAVVLLLLFAVVAATLLPRHDTAVMRQKVAPPRAFLGEADQLATAAACVDCHQEICDSHGNSPHALTLSRTDSENAAIAFDGKSWSPEGTDITLSWQLRNGLLEVRHSDRKRTWLTEWIFGSGRHARTPLITWTDQSGCTVSLEHCASAYAGGVLGPTLEMEQLPASDGMAALGSFRSHEQTVNCFGCHSGSVPVRNGRIQFDKVVAGVQCSRCHDRALQHAERMQQGLPLQMTSLSGITPEESINRCGECHRRPDELGGQLRPDDPILPRFAPVGLSQSVCFQQQSTVLDAAGNKVRFDCISCHDPHAETDPDWRFHTQVCRQCHNPDQPEHTLCSATATEDNCIRCHMPSVPAGAHLNFTNHWIRIPEEFSDAEALKSVLSQ